jgi:hypothetical protein
MRPFSFPSWKESPRLAAITILDGRCEEKGQRNHQEQHSVNRVRQRLCGGGEERKGKSSSKAKRAKLAKNLQSAPHWEASARRKVKATIKNNTV